jgi:hypothetical protein
MTEGFVDTAVPRTKFMREVEQYRKLEDEHRRRGWFLLKADFPTVHVLFTAPRLRPAAVLFVVVVDFTNYDFWPPSVRVVEPFTGKPYLKRELPLQFVQARETPMNIPGLPPGQRALIQQDLMPAFHPDELPFFCLPGVREYHDNPAHSGDSWLLHRTTGEGTLYNILEKLHRYGVEPLSGYQLGLQIVGFQQREPSP